MRKVRLVVLANELTPAGGYVGVGGVTPIAKPQFSIVIQDAAPEDEGKAPIGIWSGTCDRVNGKVVYEMIDHAMAAARDYLVKATNEK